MNNSIQARHLNPLPEVGGTLIGQRVTRTSDAAVMAGAAGIRLSLSKRERMKVRDCLQCVSGAPTKLLPKRCPILYEFGDSRIGVPEFRAAQKTDLASVRAFDRFDSCVRHHRVQRQVLRKDSRNRVRKDLAGAVVEICNQQNFGFLSAAKERVQVSSHFCGDNWLGSREGNCICVRARQKAKLFAVQALRPLTLILSPKSGRGGLANAWRALTGCRDRKGSADSIPPVSVQRTETGNYFA
jgi:hypothetical protein